MGETRITKLVDEVIESGRSPEEVCASSPELISEVRRQLSAYCLIHQQLEEFFPDSQSAEDDRLTAGEHTLPTIKGYEFISPLGRGGMGVVYLARHEKLGREVAVKLLLAGPYASAVERERFIREARSLATLRHPNIVSVYDVGESEDSLYFTMEYMRGGTLADRCRSGPLSRDMASRIARTLAEAVEHAHQCGIIHRDLKPANVLFDTDGTLKISDFGIARSGGADQAITHAGLRLGTPSYMAPEQVGGSLREAGPTTDVYALGAILYEMLSGRPPFISESPSETERQVLINEPVPLTRLNPKVPRDLETICLTCLQKDPTRRYATSEALRDDLDRYLTGATIVARPAGPVERAIRWGRRHPVHTIIAGTISLVMIGAVATGFWIQHIQNERRMETAIRETRSRQVIESALSLASDLRTQSRWEEAAHVLENAQSYTQDSSATDLDERLKQAAVDLATARRLEEIRHRYPDPGDKGYDYAAGLDAFDALFSGIGIGPDVSAETAADFIRSSAIHSELVIGCDIAGFIAHFVGKSDQAERYLSIARDVDPNPQRARFRDPRAWDSADTLSELTGVDGKRDSELLPHQIVIAAARLTDLGDHQRAIAILRDANLRFPDDNWINLELGIALYRAQAYREACQYFRAAVVIQPRDHIAWTLLASSLHLSEMNPEALLAVRRAIDLNPRYSIAWEHLLYYLVDLGRIDEAVAERDRAVGLLPAGDLGLTRSGNRIRIATARRYASRAEWAQAAAEYHQLFDGEQWTNADVIFEYAATSVLAGEMVQYEGIRQKMLELSEVGTLRPYIAARTMTLLPSSDSQLLRVDTASGTELRSAGLSHWALAERGAILVRRGRANEALQPLELSLMGDVGPGADVVGWVWLALANKRLGNDAEAELWLRKAKAWMADLGEQLPPNAADYGLHLHNWLETLILLRELEPPVE